MISSLGQSGPLSDIPNLVPTRSSLNLPQTIHRNLIITSPPQSVTVTGVGSMPPIINLDPAGLRTTHPSLPPVLNLNQQVSPQIPEGDIKRRKPFMKVLPITTNDLAKLSLVISSHLPSLVKAINQHESVLISAPTGIGKSLGVP